MAQIAYVDRLNERYQGLGFPPYRWSVYETSPWTPFTKPLKESCVALIGAAGVFREDQQSFVPWAVNDLSFRLIPKDTPLDELKLHHNYYDHRDAKKDVNCVFPLTRLLALERSSYIGRLAPLTVSLGMGRLYKRTELQQETVPKILAVLREQAVDAALLVAA